MDPELRAALRSHVLDDVRTSFGIGFVIVTTTVTLLWTASHTAQLPLQFPVRGTALAITGVTFSICAWRCVRRAERRRLEMQAAASLVRSHRARVAAEADWRNERRG